MNNAVGAPTVHESICSISIPVPSPLVDETAAVTEPLNRVERAGYTRAHTGLLQAPVYP